MAENHLMDENVKEKYPFHYHVWKNEHKILDKELSSDETDKEIVDPRGRTPLMLAVSLGHLESVKVLLKHGCSVNVQNSEGWTVVQEATATGDPDILSVILESRDLQRISSRLLGIPALLLKLSEAPDFYVEMKWEFASWVPLVSRMCPNDTYHIYKSGSNVRIDTTLLGFDETHWQRGSRSYIFKGTSNGATMMEVDHDANMVYTETLVMSDDEELQQTKPLQSVISQRLTTPIVTTYIDTDKISFERDRAGIWGWRHDRTEVINGHECKVFSASNVELATKTRVEHLSDNDKKEFSNKSAMQSLFNIAEFEQEASSKQEFTSSANQCDISIGEYFNSDCDLGNTDVGRPKEISTKVQKFKAHLWLAEDYPLKLQEQVTPIVDLMAITSSHFTKLKDFIQMQLPSGFPVKIEIPFLHVITARITFGNIFALDSVIDKVTTINDENRLACILDASLFEPPSSYAVLGTSEAARQPRIVDEDDALLQYAIQQSLLEGSDSAQEEKMDVWEAIKGTRNHTHHETKSQMDQLPEQPFFPAQNYEDSQLQKAIEESLSVGHNDSVPVNMLPLSVNDTAEDTNMALAMSLSRQQQEEDKKRLQEEEELLKKIIELSMSEK